MEKNMHLCCKWNDLLAINWLLVIVINRACGLKIIIHSQCILTGCNLTNFPLKRSYITVTHNMVLLVQQLNVLIIYVCKKELSIRKDTYAWNTGCVWIAWQVHIIFKLPSQRKHGLESFDSFIQKWFKQLYCFLTFCIGYKRQFRRTRFYIYDFMEI